MTSTVVYDEDSALVRKYIYLTENNARTYLPMH